MKSVVGNGRCPDAAALAKVSTLLLKGLVLDRTCLRGNYDVALEWSGYGPVIAFQEQLGIRIEPKRGPVEVLVIDRAERRDGNWH